MREVKSCACRQRQSSMKLRDNSPLHLTYCLNIHSGETWEENLAAIRNHAAKVRDATANGKPFGLGLRLSNTAARTLSELSKLQHFKQFLRDQNMYVFTINGFPYGTFHGKPVKETVYQPDWRTPERRDYTILLSDILAELLPDGVPGSISTVPGSYKARIKGEADIKLMVKNLRHCADHLAEIEKRAGKHITLALEPEPDCFLETTDDVLDFFKHHISFSHLGICSDTCHLAMQFEDLQTSLTKLQKAGISVPKVQLSAALATRITESSLRELEPFCDRVYLHQIRVRNDRGEVTRYKDLSPDVLNELRSSDGSELRAHLHVPLYFTGAGSLKSTASDLTKSFFDAVLVSGIPHIEIETYTFDVLPPSLRSLSVTESIVKEYDWVLEAIS
jgi:sugar phosphate isomerase/epimerase